MATFTNQATLSYRDITVSSNITTGELAEDLTAAKTAVIPTYAARDTLTYVISLVNAGSASLADLSITDDLGGYVFGGDTVYPLTYVDGSVRCFADGVLQAAPTVEAGPPLVLSGVPVSAGGSTVVLYQARVTGFAPLAQDGTILNTATVSGPALPSDVTVSETVTASDAPVLDLADDFLAQIPVFRLHCRPDTEAVEVLDRALREL